jgi:chemotaxis protein CheD
MTQNLHAVTIGAMAVTENTNDILVAYGLGSCVVVCLYDPVNQVGGMIHALLPTSPKARPEPANPIKFVDQGIPLLIEELERMGGKQSRFKVYLCGGARMLTIPGDDTLHVGARNIVAAEEALEKARLDIDCRATGGTAGRTVKFYIESGEVTIRSLRQSEKCLNGQM